MILHNIRERLEEEKILKEVYKQTDLKPVQIVLKAYLNYIYRGLSPKNLIGVENKYKIQFEVLPLESEEYLVHQATYNKTTKFTNIFLYKDTLDRIQEDSKLINQLLIEVESLFTHEDTHAQQYAKEINYRFVAPDPTKDPDGYLGHYTEIDAYARQTGYLLRQEFPNETVKEIFDKIKNNQITNKLATEKLELYSRPTFFNYEGKRFFHTLYQYLDNQEYTI